MTQSRSNDRRRGRHVSFDFASYLSSVILDLSEHLGAELASDLLGLVKHPLVIRARVKDLLSFADCMDSIPYYAALRQVEACFSKLPTFGAASADMRRARALEKFEAAERACKRVNRKIRFYRSHPRRLPDLVGTVIRMAQDELFRAFGAVPDDSSLWEKAGFGPGLTFGLTGADRNVFAKISAEQTVTPQAKGLALAVLRDQFPHWSNYLAQNSSLATVAGNRITFVPKSSDIDRTIGIEPSLNVFLQKAIDEYLKRRAPILGVQIRSQDYSISTLRRASDRVATIDLSSASDSISTELVRWLLPAEWFELLDVLRSHAYTLDKGESWTPYEKFSSMGNATTFPVESMIFSAITRACARVCGLSRYVRDSVRVYGDDIICPWECAGLVIEVLRFLGFKTNSDKTFVFGPFRETCGVDLLNGTDVRPVYLRAIPTKPWEVAGLFNRLLSNRFGFSFHRTLTWLLGLVDRPLFGPAYQGWSSVDSTDWSDWYAGKNAEGDAYFWSPTPHVEPVKVQRGEHTTLYIHMQRWGVLYRRRLAKDYDEATRYLAFLLGVEGGEPSGEPVYGVIETLFVGPFPDPIYDFPDVYAAPRPSSARAMRLVMDTELGINK